MGGKFIMNNNLENIFRFLDMDEKNGLATRENIEQMTIYQQLFFSQAKEKIGVDAVYFLRDSDGIAKIPLIYFSALDKYDPQTIAELHRLSWNMGEAPLLFIVTPDQLMIYNNYELPREIDGSLDPNAGFIETIKLVTDLENQRHKLQRYNRSLLETGEYWRTSNVRFDSKTRVDSTLMLNLKVMRKTLINRIRSRLTEKQKNSVNVIAIVHALLSRSILIKYLEERKDTTGQSVFPKGFFAQFYENATSYTDVLSSKEATYSLFKCLHQKFNGDMLPLIANEYEIITNDDLFELRDFLLGDSNLETKQLTLWPLYSFDVIPIQLISSIYELFFHLSDNEDEKGTYYTPLHLVDMLLDEVYPWEGDYRPTRILDPACGSGIFLVEAYRRIVCRWMRSNNVTTITNQQLTKLLQDSIFGIDLNEEAVRVASFSLSLAMCDFLDPKSIWEQLNFPKLINSNLSISDFFSDHAEFNDKKYDVIIGNPPWQSQLTHQTVDYLNKKGKVVGDKQIAQAFSLKCADLCMDKGVICLLMPSKGFLFNRSSKSAKYRKDFLSDYSVSVIINFSAYRKFLFDHASAPATGIIYSPSKPDNDKPILYCTPKPQYTLEDLRKFSVEPNDICRIPLDIAQDDRIWKIAMWGGPRDLELIDKMQSTFMPLKAFLEKYNMDSAEGFKRGNKSKICNDFIDYPVVEANNFIPFYVDKNSLKTIDYNTFERMSDSNRQIFKAPHLIIKQSHRASRFLASVLDYDAVFNHSLLGIHGNLDLLKYLCLIVNSKVFSYYHLMTSRTWMVERDALEAGDIRQMPIPIPNEEQLQEAVDIFNESIESGDISKVNQIVFKMYHLEDYEIALIDDAITYIYDYFHLQRKSRVFRMPSNTAFHLYLATLKDVLNNTFDKSVIHESHFYIGESPLAVLLLLLDGKSSNEPIFHMENDDAKELLRQLDTTLTEVRQNVFVRRNVRVYGKNSIYIIKPMQLRYWNYSSACRDGDEIFADIMKAWRGDNE